MTLNLKLPKFDPQDIKDLIKVFIITTLIVCLFTCSGCYGPKKAFAGIERAISKYPAQSAEQTRNHFPCVTTHKDSVITQTDTVVYVDCPNLFDSSAVEYAGKDTVVKTVVKILPVTKTIRVPVTLPVKTITVTQKVKDSAEVFIIQDKLNAANKRADKATGSLHTWRGIGITFFLLCCILGFLLVNKWKHRLFGL